jgi:hypothetical protein
MNVEREYWRRMKRECIETVIQQGSVEESRYKVDFFADQDINQQPH